jgi:hypothetical protein
MHKKFGEKKPTDPADPAAPAADDDTALLDAVVIRPKKAVVNKPRRAMSVTTAGGTRPVSRQRSAPVWSA